MKKDRLEDKVINIFSHGFVTIFSLLCMFPFFYVISYSITSYADYLKNPARLIPPKITLIAYKQLLNFPLIYSGYKITIFITVVGTILSVLLLLISAYPLTKKDLKGRNIILALITFTMFFNGGLIPNYYLIRNLHLLNTPWALILPGVLSVYNLLVMKTFINNIPDSLEESAVIDGANEIVILIKIVLPLSLPVIATFSVFSAVGYWNSFFNAIIYTTKRNLWPLMLILRELVVEDGAAQASQGVSDPNNISNPFTLKMAAIIIATVPILLTYPFAQKYFTKGILLGSVKG